MSATLFCSHEYSHRLAVGILRAGSWAGTRLPGSLFPHFCRLRRSCRGSRGRQHGSLFAGLVIWLVAGLLLQGLPHTDTGIQFIPLLPWSYSGWIARIISAQVG